MCAVLCSVVERISEVKQIEETSGDEALVTCEAPVTCEKEAYLFPAPRSGTESAFSLQANHAGIYIVMLRTAMKMKPHSSAVMNICLRIFSAVILR